MAQSQPWQWIPTSLTLEQFEEFVLPHLPKGSRGPHGKTRNQFYITPAVIDRWFFTTPSPRPSYAVRLAATLSIEQIAAIQKAISRHLLRQTVAWSRAIAFCYCQNP